MFGMFFAILAMQLAPDAAATLPILLAPQEAGILRDGLKEVAFIDQELAAITEHQEELRSSTALRVETVTALKARFSDIAADDSSSVEEIYASLISVRKTRADRITPLAKENARLSDLAVCSAKADVRASTDGMKASDDYKSSTLARRLEWRKLFADIDALSKTASCEGDR